MARGANTRPTAAYQAPNQNGAAEDINRAASTCAGETAKATRSVVQEELAAQREHETTRKGESK